jgi:hypothetical protein
MPRFAITANDTHTFERCVPAGKPTHNTNWTKGVVFSLSYPILICKLINIFFNFSLPRISKSFFLSDFYKTTFL